MKINRKLLLSAVDTVRHVAAKRTTLPICNHLRIEAVNNRLTLQATDCNQWIELAVDCDGDLNPICVHPTLLTNLICDGDDVMLEIADKKLNVTSSAVASLSFLDAKEFPPFPKDKVTQIAVDSANLANAINAVSWAAANPNEGRNKFEGVHILASAKLLTVEACNGRVLSNWQTSAICSDIDLVIQPEYAQRIASFLATDGARVEVSDRYILVTSISGRYLAARTNINYPNTKVLLKDREKPIGEFPVDMFTEFAGRALSIYSTDVRLTPTVRLEFGNNGTTASVKTELASMSVSHKGKYKDAKICVDANYLKSACRSFTEKEIAVEIRDDLGPLVLSAGDLTVVIAAMRWS